MKRAQEEWKHDIVYDLKGHDDLYVCTDLLYDFKGHGNLYGLYGLYDLVYDPKRSQGY